MNEHVSDYALDKRAAGLLEDDAARAIDAHLEACERCRERHARWEQDRARFEAHARTSTAQASTARTSTAQTSAARTSGTVRSLRFLGPAGVVLAAAAALLVVLGPGTSPQVTPPDRTAGEGRVDVRRKGSERFGYVRRAPDGRVLGEGEVPLRTGTEAGGERTGAEEAPGRSVAAHPGDRFEWTVHLDRSRYVAVLSRDGNGEGSVYFPDVARAARVTPGVERLPLAVVLDDSLGEEHIYALACDRPIELEPLRRSLEASPAPPGVPDGCAVTALELDKTATQGGAPKEPAR